MEIAYLGLPEGALALLEGGHRIVAAGTNRRTGARLEALEAALARRGVPLRIRPDLRAGAARADLLGGGAPLLVCYLWDRVLPGDLLERFGDGAVGYHPSLLPRHRGPDPYFWTLWTGDAVAGASVFRVTSGLDTGPVLAQRQIPVEPGWTAGDLADRLDPLGLALLVEVVGRWARSGPLVGTRQDEGAATAAPAPDDELLAIRWSWPARRIERLVRAAAPHPGAFTVVGDDSVVVLRAHAVDLPAAAGLAPGEAASLGDRVLVWTGQGGLVLDEVVGPGGERLEGPEVGRAFR